MPFTIIKGTFKPEAGRPDGDSIRFLPNNHAHLYRLPCMGYPPRLSKRSCTINLRYEGIDAVERNAIEPFASNATTMNRQFLGVPNENDESCGYILTRLIGPYGRPICFVFEGEAPENDGNDVYLNVERMQESVNFQLVQAGIVYPLFYDTLFSELREAIAEGAATARENGSDLWSKEQNNNVVTWNGPSSLPTLDPIFPKIWRRLEDYTQNKGFRDEADTLDAFDDFLNFKKDRLLILSESRYVNFNDIITINGNTLQMSHLPENLIFMSK